MNQNEIDLAQDKICRKYNAGFHGSGMEQIVGVADNVMGSSSLLHGLRHSMSTGTTGWYIWAGAEEPSTRKDFFRPIQLGHLIQARPELVPYLGLAPGWRFLIDTSTSHEDVWRDDNLLLV